MIERHLNIIKEAAKWQNIATFNKEKVELSPEMLDINETPESVEIKEGAVKDVLHNWMEAIPKNAVKEIKKLMHGSLLSHVARFDRKMRIKLIGELNDIAKKYKMEKLKTEGVSPGDTIYDYFDTFYPEREPSKNKKQTSPKVTVYHMKDSVETVPEEDTLLEHDGTKIGFMNRKNIADGWFETAPKGTLTNTPFKFYPPTSGKSVLMTHFQVEDLVKDLTKALEARTKGKGSGESWATRMLAGPSDSWQ